MLEQAGVLGQRAKVTGNNMTPSARPLRILDLTPSARPQPGKGIYGLGADLWPDIRTFPREDFH
jgi:hypothetical protein